MSIQKAVIPAAGFGTRMLPAAKAVPKELLPVLDRPTLQYVVEEAAAAGANEIVLITSKDKPALAAHFEHNPLLALQLRKSGREQLLATIDKLIGQIRLVQVFQEEQLGLGHAMLQARQAVGDEPFVCLLGDTIFSTPDNTGELPAAQLRDAFDRFGTSIIGLEMVPEDRVERYGIVGGEMIEPGVMKLTTLVEKPPRDKAPSRYAIAARYILTPTIFECLDATAADSRGEIQLTDALRRLLEREPIHGVVLGARRHDIGNPLDWLKTNLIFAARDRKLWQQILPTIESLLRAQLSQPQSSRRS